MAQYCDRLWTNNPRLRFSFYSVFLHVRLYFSVCGSEIYDRPKYDRIRRNTKRQGLLHFDSKSSAYGNLAAYHEICNKPSTFERSAIGGYNMKNVIDF
jgi:hypothetical protein